MIPKAFFRPITQPICVPSRILPCLISTSHLATSVKCHAGQTHSSEVTVHTPFAKYRTYTHLAASL